MYLAPCGAGRVPEALSDTEEALRLQPGSPEVLVLRARVFAALGRWREACQACVEAEPLTEQQVSGVRLVVEGLSRAAEEAQRERRQEVGAFWEEDLRPTR